MKKRNKFAKDLMTTKYRSRIVKAKKAKEALKERKNISLTISSYNLAPTFCIILEESSVPFSRLFFKSKLFT